MNGKLEIYLAGKGVGLTVAQANMWRRLFKHEIDSLVAVSNLTHNYRCINPNDYYNYEMVPAPDNREVMNYFLHQVRNCNLLIADVSMDSLGTTMEIQCAAEHHIPILLINTTNNPIYNWVLLQAEKVFSGDSAIKEAAEYVTQYYFN